MSASARNTSAQSRPSWTRRLLSSALVRLELALELLFYTGSLAGIPLALTVGKFLLAAVLAAVALGVYLRLVGRRKLAARALHPVRMPRWHSILAGLLSFLEVAALVHAAELSVRADQPEFTALNWLLVLLAFGLAFGVQRLALRHLFSGQGRVPTTSVDSQK